MKHCSFEATGLNVACCLQAHCKLSHNASNIAESRADAKSFSFNGSSPASVAFSNYEHIPAPCADPRPDCDWRLACSRENAAIARGHRGAAPHVQRCIC